MNISFLLPSRLFWQILKRLEQEKKIVFVYFRITKGNGTLGEAGTASW
jgi:hypothetical protein